MINTRNHIACWHSLKGMTENPPAIAPNLTTQLKMIAKLPVCLKWVIGTLIATGTLDSVLFCKHALDLRVCTHKSNLIIRD